MGFFKSIFGKKPTDPLTKFFGTELYKRGKADYEDIFERSKAISGGDREVVNAVRFALDEPIKYFRENAQRYLDRGIDFDKKNFGEDFLAFDLLELAAADELENRGYVSRVSIECGLSEFRQGLAKVKDYEKIKNAVETLELSEDGDIVIWTEEINAALEGKAYVAFIIEMVEETFSLAITDRETSEKINGEIQTDNGRT